MDGGSSPGVADELSKRAVCQEYCLNWRPLAKMLAHAEPPGYRRKAQREKPVGGQHLAWIHELLEHNKQGPPKQRHTAKRILDRRAKTVEEGDGVRALPGRRRGIIST